MKNLNLFTWLLECSGNAAKIGLIPCQLRQQDGKNTAKTRQKDGKSSIYRRIITLLTLLLTLNVGQMWGDATVYFVNKDNWSQVNAHCYNTGDSDKETNWPGYTATKTALKIDGYDVYSYTTAKSKIIFSENGSNQTADLTVTDGYYYYSSYGSQLGRYFDGNTNIYWTTNPTSATWWNNDNNGKYIYFYNDDGSHNSGIQAGNTNFLETYYLKVPKGIWSKVILLRGPTWETKNNQTGGMPINATNNYMSNWSENGAAATWGTLKDITVYIYVGEQSDAEAQSVEINAYTPYVGDKALASGTIKTYNYAGADPKFTRDGDWLSYTFEDVTKITLATCARAGGNIFTSQTLTDDVYYKFDGTELLGKCIAASNPTWGTAPANAALGAGTMTATVSGAPTGATISWSSDNSSAISVNSSGVITYNAVGNATITAHVTWDATGDYCAGSYDLTKEISCTSGATVSASLITSEYVAAGVNGQVSLSITSTGASTGWKYRIKNTGTGGYYDLNNIDASSNSTTWTMTNAAVVEGTNTIVVELYNSSSALINTSSSLTIIGETAYNTTIVAAGTNGSVSPSGTVYANNNHVHPTITATANDHYQFVNWTSNNVAASVADDDAEETTVTATAAGYTITANFAPNQYTITYKDKDNVTYTGTNEASLPSSYTYGTGITTLTAGVKAGYRFDGWYDNSSCTGDAVTSISTTATGAKTLYAKWSHPEITNLSASAGDVYSGEDDITLTATRNGDAAGINIQYQVKVPGGSWTNIGEAVNSTTQSYSPTAGDGTYAFRAYPVGYSDNSASTTKRVYEHWTIYVHDVQGWGKMDIYSYTDEAHGTWPGTSCSTYNGTSSWYTVTLDSKGTKFILNKHGEQTESTDVKTGDLTTGTSSGKYAAGTYWYIDNFKGGDLQSVTVSDPTVDISSFTVINTNQIKVIGNITNCGGDGTAASDMKEVGFKIGETKYSASCLDGTSFTRYITGLTAGTTYSVKAYAENVHGTGESSSQSITTRAAGTTTIKVRTGHGRTAPKVYAYTDETAEGCNGAKTENAVWPGEAMTIDITGTIYDWYTYDLSIEFNNFIVSETGNDNKTDDFANPFEDKCYYYKATEVTQSNRMGEMSCPSALPQLMINAGDGIDGVFSYYDFGSSESPNKIQCTRTLSAKTEYLFKPVYNAEWYGKAGTNVTRDANTITELSASVEDNLAMTTDVAGTYTFKFNTSSKEIEVVYPDAYTVTFGYGTGGTSVTATATNPAGTINSGDYVAGGTDVTFAETHTEGYSLKGWYTTADGNTTVETMGVSDNILNSISTDATVYAQYTPNNYTVTFNATTNGGTCATESKSVTFDAAYGELPVATLTAKEFVGWFTTASDSPTPGTRVTAETIVSTASDHTLFARFEDTYEVTVAYKCGEVTLYPSTKVTASASSLTPEITAPDILGYEFSSWTGTNVTPASSTSATTSITATASTTITANYTAVPTVYFKNNLGWENVYVTFDCYFNSSKQDVPANKDKPYFKMTQLGTSDIYYCAIPADYTASNYASWAWNIAFDNTNMGSTAETTHTGIWDAFCGGEFLGRGDFDPNQTMFIPYKEDYETRNSGKCYTTGCWMTYNSTSSGYQVNINKAVTGSGDDTTYVALEADIAGGFEFKATVNLKSTGYTYGIKLYKKYAKNNKDLWYSNSGEIWPSNLNTLPWDFAAKVNGEAVTATTQRCGLHTEAKGDYTITVSFATGKPMVNVEYPVSAGDYQLVYKDLATWSGDAHTAAWQHPSRVIKANANAEDIVSFFVSKADGANASIKLHKCTSIDGSGNPVWDAGTTVDLSGITKTGIYNFKVTQDADKDATVTFDGGYTGNFYIRTDASDGGWSNYKTSGKNTMTYSEYAESQTADKRFSHYFMRHVNNGQNIKFCIANDYSECISDTLVDDTYASEWIGNEANIRFMWYHATNKISRAYLSGSTIVSDRFLVLEGDDKMFDANGDALNISGLNANEINFTDDQNWIYETTVKAQPNARIKLTAKFADKIQYFYGTEGDRSEATTEELLGGTGTDKYTLRIVYDFKTNRLIKAFIPSGTITTGMAINTDLMIIREHQGDAQQISFSGDGALSDVKTVYGAMKFNKWTVNNKLKADGHAEAGLSAYARDLFWISFPFEVKLGEVFGFGTYGKHWIIEYYDGKGRAQNGFWADSPTNWKFVTPQMKNTFILEANQGYVLALDLEEMTEESSIWNNGVEDVYIYFPSSATVEDIQSTSKQVDIDQDGYQCTINRPYGSDGDRRVKDSYWHVIGVPSYANYNSDLTDVSGGTTIDWRSTSMPFLYEWNPSTNALSITSSATFNFKAMHSYLVQYSGASIYWSAINATPSSVAARTMRQADCNLQVELLQGENVEDKTLLRMTEDEAVTNAFEFNYDLCKENNKNRSNIWTITSDNLPVAGNSLPFSDETIIIPVGVSIASNGEYTLAMPEVSDDISVVLIDNEYGTRTDLRLMDYDVNLTAGTYSDRFMLELRTARGAATDIEGIEGGTIKDGKAHKFVRDGIMYILRDGVIYDAMGKRVK